MLQPAIDRYLCGQRRVPIAAVARSLSVLVFAVAATAPTQLQAQSRLVVRRVPPTYPPIAKQMRITGTVVVTATVDPTGKVLKAESTSGNKLLSTSAIDAVKQWKFAPGESTESFPVAVSFALENN